MLVVLLGFLDLVLALVSLAVAGSIYWYSSAVSCPKYGFATESHGVDCTSFFLVICVAIVLVSAYLLMHFLAGRHSYKPPRHRY